MPIDNRNKDKSDALQEIENDDTPIDEDTPEDKAEDTPDDEDIPADDEGAEGNQDEDPEDAPEDPDHQAPIVKLDDKKPKEEDKDERYRQSTREAQLQYERNQHLTETIETAANIQEPTEAELKAYVTREGADWDVMSPFERVMAKKTYMSEQKFALVHSAVKDIQQVDAWAGKVTEFIETNETGQTYKLLIGKEEEFKRYCMKAAHRGMDLTTLASAFLFNARPNPKQRGQLFNTGGGGGEAPKPENKYTDADYAAKLRKNDPREYRRQVQAGRIKIEV